MMKSVGAVAAGVGANLLAIPVDLALLAAGLVPAPGEPLSDAALALAFGYRLALTVLGGWVTARLAPSAPLRHGLVLAALGTLLAAVGAAAQWNLGHHWYPLSLLVSAFPATLAGTRLTPGART
ncbi:MAG: hypothetical protein K1X89_07255 [Myxococcaceae bacterium]|nr:hypothetical protein [Myxococcaceae bacterium]